MTRSTGSTRNITRVHPESPCTNTKNYKDSSDKITGNTSNRASVKNLAKDVKKISRAFTPVNNQLQNLKEADPDLSDS